MGKIIFLFIIVTCSTLEIYAQSFEILTKEDSSEYANFIKNFPKAKLREKYHLKLKSSLKIEYKYVKKFICDFCNFCEKSQSSAPINYFYIEQYKEFDNFDLILYLKKEIELPANAQYILATYSKKNGKLISKIILVGYIELTSYTYTLLDKNNLFNIITLYSTEKENLRPNPLYPEYFWIYEEREIYKLNDSGNFILVETIDPIQHIAKRSNIDEKYEYPVKIPQ